MVMTKSGIKSLGTSMVGKSRSSVRSAKTSAGSSPRGAHAGTSDDGILIVSRDDPTPSKTDWAAVDAQTDDDIADAVEQDPDAVPIGLDWSDAVLVMPAKKKKVISIWIDQEVLDYFKKPGKGYQRRMNAVLRSYVDRALSPKKRK
jgi:uncharacterized protein (DUF4415 family)